MTSLVFRRGLRNGLSRGITPRRLAAANRHLRLERERFPLFADQIAVEQPSPEQRIVKADENWNHFWGKFRTFSASQWRFARRVLRSLPADRRRDLIQRWNASPYPKEAHYLLSFLRVELGEDFPRGVGG